MGQVEAKVDGGEAWVGQVEAEVDGGAGRRPGWGRWRPRWMRGQAEARPPAEALT